MEQTTGKRQRGVTRDRILDVALELFNEHGYDKTSLREIAEQLGVTKAALYYHFEKKEDILLELHLRLHELGRSALDRLDTLDNEQQIVRPGLRCSTSSSTKRSRTATSSASTNATNAPSTH